MADLTAARLAPSPTARTRPHRAEFVPAYTGAAAIGDYVALLKPRVMSLVVFTGWVGLYLAPGHLNPVLAFTAMIEAQNKLSPSRTDPS